MPHVGLDKCYLSIKLFSDMAAAVQQMHFKTREETQEESVCPSITCTCTSNSHTVNFVKFLKI